MQNRAQLQCCALPCVYVWADVLECAGFASVARVTDIDVAHLQKDCASRMPIRPIATSNSMVLATPTAAILDPNGAGDYHVCADELNISTSRKGLSMVNLVPTTETKANAQAQPQDYPNNPFRASPKCLCKSGA
jgi:hypothetical protein